MSPTPENPREEIFSLGKNELLEFYDKKNTHDEELGSPITAVTALIGEDLVLGLFDHYLVSGEGDGVVWDQKGKYQCTTGNKKGPRLDAWILTKKQVVYQAEIKNWCASAFGGKGVSDSSCAANEDVTKKMGAELTWSEAAFHNRKRYLTSQDCARPVWKVLVKMNKPATLSNKEERHLLLFWSPVAPFAESKSEDPKPFFAVNTSEFQATIKDTGLDLPTPCADEVYIFSASNYLRASKNSVFEIRMPRVAQRLSELRKLGIKLT